MVITPPMIEFVLRQRGIDACAVGNRLCEVERISVYRSGKRTPGVLYIYCDQAPQKTPPPTARYAFLQMRMADDAPASGNGGAHRHVSEEERALEEACAALRELDQWDARLKDALLQRVPFSEFMRIGASLLACPFAYFDRNLITLASTDEYWVRSRLPEAGGEGLHVIGQMPSEIAVDLVEDLDYLHAAEKREPFYYQSAQGRIFYGINTFDDGEYLARLVFVLPDGETRLHPGEEQLAVQYHRYLYALHLHYGGNVEVASSQNDSLHVLIRSLLIEGATLPQAEMTGVLSSTAWDQHDDFMTVKLVFFEGVHWDTISLYLCGLLEREMIASCAFPLERSIVWTVNLTRSSKGGEDLDKRIERLTEALVSIMRDYACRAGLSDVFSDLMQAHRYYLEAERALEVGQVRASHKWYFQFGDYAFDYLMAKSSEEFTGEQLCHPALAQLIRIDAEQGTDYARTLVCFLRNSQSTTRAADELFIHRTSFMRRMNQVLSLTGVNLDDPDTVLHLLLSAKLLGM